MDDFEVQECPQAAALRRDSMRTPDDVSAMMKLKDLGWGVKRIAAELGVFEEHGEALAGDQTLDVAGCL
jgi:hypothetical protein